MTIQMLKKIFMFRDEEVKFLEINRNIYSFVAILTIGLSFIHVLIVFLKTEARRNNVEPCRICQGSIACFAVGYIIIINL